MLLLSIKGPATPFERERVDDMTARAEFGIEQKLDHLLRACTIACNGRMMICGRWNQCAGAKEAALLGRSHGSGGRMAREITEVAVAK